MDKGKVLFVDDESRVLETFRRNLRKYYDVTTAVGPEAGLATIRGEGPFAVIVSDLKMPGMDGIQFLAKAREINPDSVRVMLTGFADVDNAVGAVNEGHVFRFLTKPCSLDVLMRTLDACLEQYRLITAEKELLRGTLRGSIKVLTEVLSLVNPEAFGRCERIRRMVMDLGKALQFDGLWKLDLAAMLSQIGCIGVPETILRKHFSGDHLTVEEKRAFNKYPGIGASLLAHIPRLEEVGEIIAGQNMPFPSEEKVHPGARLLKVALDYDELEQAGRDKNKAVGIMRSRQGMYEPRVLEMFLMQILGDEGYIPRAVDIIGLREGMLLAEDVRTNDDVLLMVRGQEVTGAILMRIKGFAISHGIKEPLLVQEPIRKKKTE